MPEGCSRPVSWWLLAAHLHIVHVLHSSNPQLLNTVRSQHTSRVMCDSVLDQRWNGFGLLTGVCGASAARQQQLQQLLARYPKGPPAAAHSGTAQQAGPPEACAAEEAAAGCSYGEESPEQQLYK
jgi:hypothetical protein